MTTLTIWCREDEKDQVKLAASLRAMSTTEYIRRALNVQLRKDGVDAVLFPQSDDE